MQYFKDFPRVEYVFGDQIDIGGQSVTTEIYQDISAYVDIIDEVKDNSSFYTFYNVQDGDRPDQTSTYIYGTPVYHWTFFLLNDKLKEKGWPLSNRQVELKVKQDFPHRWFTTRNLMTGIHLVNQAVVGLQSGARGIVLRRNLDLGLVYVEMKTTSNFVSGEVIRNVARSDGTGEVIVSATDAGHLAPHHYVDGSGNRVDIDPLSGPGASLTTVTNQDRYFNENDDLKQIKVIKPESIEEITSLFKQAISS